MLTSDTRVREKFEKIKKNLCCNTQTESEKTECKTLSSVINTMGIMI